MPRLPSALLAWSLLCSAAADQRSLIDAALKITGGSQTLIWLNCKWGF
jgi:hypothetical protein